ncbi:MAG: universal stress protein [Myxococcota bacterium]|nr:universal stress protein [Myxococcota bacterium]
MSAHTTESAGLRQIVLGTDFSETAELATDHAAHLARRHGARLTVVHGHTTGIYWIAPSKPLSLPSQYEDQILREIQTKLKDIEERLTALNVSVETRLIASAGADAALYVAQSVGADLIVTGTRGHTGFKHLLLGSTAEQIVRGAKAPVLAVHPGDDANEKKPLHIVLPTDFSDDALSALKRAVELFSGDPPAPCSLTLVHVLHSPSLMTPVLSDPSVRRLFLEQAKNDARQALRALAQPLEADGHQVESRVLEGDPGDTLAKVAREVDASLIAMGTRGLTGWKRVVQGSVADRTLRHAECPVLTLPRESPSKD